MTTTLEKAIAALKAEIGRAFDAKPLPFAGESGNWSARGDMQTLDLEVCVRAVLLAVREPDDVMEDATDMESHPSTNFTAMIDAILNEGEPK